MTSQPETELNQEADYGDDAALAYLAKAREPQQQSEPEEEEEPEQQEDDGADPPPQDDPNDWLKKTHKISVQGQEQEITAEEAFKGYMRDADYRQKTERAAELTRQAEQERQAIQQEREQRANHLDTLAAALQMELVGDESRLPELLETDPVGYLRMKQHIDERRQLLQQAAQQRQLLHEQSARDAERSYQTYVAEEQGKLEKALPEWRDAKVRDAEAKAIGDYLRGRGYAADELNMLTDHRALLIARDAMRWQKQQEIKGKQTPAPGKPVPPGTRNQPQGLPAKAVQDLAAKAKRTHSTEDAMAYLASRRKQQ